ncbi:MAG TPA: hypothetical protein V6C95_11745 [Coleofasciculaceae cyanobacterium]
MAITYPILETQLRLIRALQKGYIEALEAGDWQAADYRCAHLQKLCEGLHYLSQLLDRSSSPEATTQKTTNSWVSSIRSTTPLSSSTQSLSAIHKPVASSPSPEGSPESIQTPLKGILHGIKPQSIDEIWE